MGLFRKDKDAPAGPDYSEIDSIEKAQALAARGVLVPALLLPEMFGGEAVPPNTVYVPPFAAELKAHTEANVVRALAQDGKVTRYSAKPEYGGDSFVPIAVTLLASDPGEFRYRIAIWGEALAAQATAAE